MEANFGNTYGNRPSNGASVMLPTIVAEGSPISDISLSVLKVSKHVKHVDTGKLTLLWEKALSTAS
ncbi:hypothetical protein VCSRO102_3054 [Vibrio cholerae]|nr:hypothetical protein VCSRO102_3054 [Vibrio cholerae]